LFLSYFLSMSSDLSWDELGLALSYACSIPSSSGAKSACASTKATPCKAAAAPAAKKAAPADDDMDFFGCEEEEEDTAAQEAADKARAERMAKALELKKAADAGKEKKRKS